MSRARHGQRLKQGCLANAATAVNYGHGSWVPGFVAERQVNVCQGSYVDETSLQQLHDLRSLAQREVLIHLNSPLLVARAYVLRALRPLEPRPAVRLTP